MCAPERYVKFQQFHCFEWSTNKGPKVRPGITYNKCQTSWCTIFSRVHGIIIPLQEMLAHTIMRCSSIVFGRGTCLSIILSRCCFNKCGSFFNNGSLLEQMRPLLQLMRLLLLQMRLLLQQQMRVLVQQMQLVLRQMRVASSTYAAASSMHWHTAVLQHARSHVFHSRSPTESVMLVLLSACACAISVNSVKRQHSG